MDEQTVDAGSGVPGAGAGDGASPRPGLRERKKQRRRETIARVALELFDRQGFAATTIPQIAEEADVSPRTVSSYFPAKEDLVFPDTEEAFARLDERLRLRQPGESATDALRAWIMAELPGWEGRDAQLRMQRRVIESDVGLQALERHHHTQAERRIAEAIAADLGTAPDELEPRMAAAATIAIFDVLGEHRKQEPEEAPMVPNGEQPEALALLDRALTFVGAGVRAMRDYDDRPATA
ncbi:TetR/AcrR family transcriptional regulator [Patulibacter defluvii]|uniref:TetR/AcrR family transcriptional regulator n=1 Tax=Patulibacter defluvii TaxID=3095358 RepID=UPI002A765F37|nr:TetR family transcriptional regulator [Patulibacter sp. DM4]